MYSTLKITSREQKAPTKPNEVSRKPQFKAVDNFPNNIPKKKSATRFDAENLEETCHPTIKPYGKVPVGASGGRTPFPRRSQPVDSGKLRLRLEQLMSPRRSNLVETGMSIMSSNLKMKQSRHIFDDSEANTTSSTTVCDSSRSADNMLLFRTKRQSFVKQEFALATHGRRPPSILHAPGLSQKVELTPRSLSTEKSDVDLDDDFDDID